MVLSELLSGAGWGKPFWIEAGAAMIAIDTLVHNFLARTGILNRANADHPYGLQCYASGGCADIINVISSNIDSRQFNSRFPSNFPRFVQKSIWHYCAAEGLNVCNGNKIKDVFAAVIQSAGFSVAVIEFSLLSSSSSSLSGTSPKSSE